MNYVTLIEISAEDSTGYQFYCWCKPADLDERLNELTEVEECTVLRYRTVVWKFADDEQTLAS